MVQTLANTFRVTSKANKKNLGITQLGHDEDDWMSEIMPILQMIASTQGIASLE